MSVATPGVRLTYHDLLLLPEDRNRHELIDGEHYVTPPPNTRHQGILGNLHFLIRAWLEDHPIGRVFFAPVDVVVTEYDVVEPDLLFMSLARAADILTPQHATGVPELVVEVASKSTRRRDATIKHRFYERAGVSEYWIVDPQCNGIRVFRREGDRFARPMELSLEAGDVLTTPLLPGLEMPLARIFGD